MKLKFLLIIVLSISIHTFSQTRIKVMTYNLMHFPSTLVDDDGDGTFTERTPVLKEILDTYQPDLFSVCELGTEEGADMILQTALQTDDNRYDRANFVYNQSSTDNTLQQLVFYNTKKLTLVSQDVIQTNIRDINHYTFQINYNVEAIYLDVFVTHLKSSTGSDNVLKRLQMVQEFTNYLTNLPQDRFVIFTGDFNLYTSTESAYQEILDSTNAIVMVDPIDSPGSWSNNYTFAPIHTQSPLTTRDQFNNGDGITGGLDDRFDFIMVSENLMSDPKLKYVTNTYKAYGNNGNCYNSYISNPDCSGDFSQELRNLLFNMSDHIPVVMELETPYALSTNEVTSRNFIKFGSSNVSSDIIILSISDDYLHKTYQIINQLGQTVKTSSFEEQRVNIDISHFASGLYFIKSANGETPLKFIKL